MYIILILIAIINGYYASKAVTLYRNYKVTVSLMIMAMFVIRIAIVTVQGIRLYIDPETELLSDTVAIGGIVVGFLYMLIFESFWSTHFDNVKIMISSSFATLTLVFIILSRNPVIGAAIQSQFSFFIQLTVPLFFFYVAFSIWKLLGKMILYATPFQKKSLKIIRTAILLDYFGIPFFMMIGLIVFTTPSNPLPPLTDDTFIWFSIIPSIFYLLIDITWYFAFIRYDSFSPFQIQRVEHLIVTNEDGISIFEYSPSEATSVDKVLISGALFAIQAVLREGAKISGNLKSIQIESYYLLFSKVDHITTIIFTTQPSKYLINVSNVISSELAKTIGDGMVDIDVDEVKEIVIDTLYPSSL